MTIPQALQIAVQQYRAGLLANAEGLCRKILEVQPNCSDAALLLGSIFHQSNRQDIARELICKTILKSPDDPYAYFALGEAFRSIGIVEEAITAYRRAIELKSDYVEAFGNLGVTLAKSGKFREAIATYQEAIQIAPGRPEIHINLGVAQSELGEFDEAIASYRRAVEINPNYPESHNNLGNALRARGWLDEAVLEFGRSLRLKPEVPEVLYNLANALRERGRIDDAIEAFRKALELEPKFTEALNDLGSALMDRGQRTEAVAAFRQALKLKPDYPEAYNNLGNALKDGDQLDEAVAAFHRAVEFKSLYPDAHANLGVALAKQGRLDEAHRSFRRALVLAPDCAWAHSNLVFTLHYHPNHDIETISDEQKRWNSQFSDPLKRFILPHTNDRNPGRLLRVGYVSPDFRDHPVGRFILPLLERHHRERFEVFCYSGVIQPDWMTERLRAAPSIWRTTVGDPDDRLAAMIREDQIDILVDLAMHTAGNRLPMFALQPAPVQVTWLAYPGTTGLQGISYRLTDARLEPEEGGPDWSVEEPVHLPDCWCCYDPIGDYPAINALPATLAGGVTFGSLNNFSKVNEDVLALWARVLNAVKGSRLLMLCPKGTTRVEVHAFFNDRGVASERLDLVGNLPRWEYLNAYHRIDIGLDPFPCNGMTTTCDALWMGVPVLTLTGRTPTSRAGLSLLSNVGLGEFVATSGEEYLRMAKGAAANLPYLADLRIRLRSRMQASRLMDAPRFTQNVENAYRSMWKRWCAADS